MGLQTTFSGLLPLLVPDLPNCPKQVILQYARQAARDFCIETEAWQEELAPIDLVDETVDYTLVIPYDAEVRRIMEVYIRTEEDVDDGLDGTLQDYDKYEFTPPTTLTLDDSIEPQDDVTDGLVVKVVLVPQLFEDVHSETTQAGISSTFLNSWAEPIIARTLYLLKRMTRKDWSDPQGAALALSDYNRGVTAAKQEVEAFKYRSEQDGMQG
jgi:hypothetical protein